MSLLDDETLRQVGLFAIEFSILDDYISAVAALLLECSEWDVAEHLTKDLNIGRKLDQIRSVCNVLAKTHELKDTEVHKAFLKQITIAKELTDERNAVIHGELIVKRGELPVTRLKNQKPVEISPGALARLVQKIDSVSNNLFDGYSAFMAAVGEARKKPSKRKP